MRVSYANKPLNYLFTTLHVRVGHAILPIVAIITVQKSLAKLQHRVSVHPVTKSQYTHYCKRALLVTSTVHALCRLRPI